MGAHEAGAAPRTTTSATPVGRSLTFERTVTVVTGLLVLAAGVLALVVGAGLAGTFRARRSVIDPLALRWLRDNPRIAVAAAIALGVVLLALGVWWITRSVRPEARPNIRLAGGPGGGTTVTAPAMTEAIRNDARGIDGVTRVRVRMAGSPRRPNLRLVIALHEGTDVRRVWEELDRSVLSRARRALETETLRTAVRLELDRAPRRRVDRPRGGRP